MALCIYCSIVVLLGRHYDETGIGFVTLVLVHNTNSVVGSISRGTRVVSLLDSSVLTISREANSSSLGLLFWPVVVGTWVHVGVRHSQIFPNICANPVGGVLMVHGDLVCFVLAGAWHV